MKCIYCGNRMLFNAIDDKFICPECSAGLTILQHSELQTVDSVCKYEMLDTKPQGMEIFNNDGISTYWRRGRV